MDKFELVRFTDNGFGLDVRADLQHDTVWLTREEMALLFGVDRTRIIRHVNNIYSEGELERDGTSAESAQVQLEGTRKVTRTTRLYNLDMIISIGYRVRSKRGIASRRWVNSVLKDYFIVKLIMNLLA